MADKKIEETPASQANDTPAPPSKKPHYATRDFNDAGTARQFTKGQNLNDLDQGHLANYIAAGLASTDKPEADASA